MSCTNYRQALKEAGLSHINVSLDTLQHDRFTAITRRKGLEQVHAGINAALAAGYGGRLKVTCTCRCIA
jgi:GTP 3',8-cyclase